MTRLPPVLNPGLNAPGYLAAASAIFAAAVVIYNSVNHHAPVDVPVVFAGLVALASLVTRHLVTPVAAPRDNAGNSLVPAPAAAPPLPAPGAGGGGVQVIPQPAGTPVAQPMPPED